ncbi:MAG: FkbM family methyltransferase [Candidatus Binataceae bacterium]|jgi:FkbM family methyltransferase
MSFISYAQNQEDVMLYRALREVKEGFYIDVGAQDPVIDSVTKAFYERGWRGINIEPNEEYFRKLQDDRPHDINLLTAVGREPGPISFYEVVHTGLSTTSAVYARGHAEAGYEVHLRNVPCTTLDTICADCGVETVHFLKIDVEGSERAVLEGFSFETVRPWIVVVEATEPNSTHEVSAEWEHLLVGRRYQFVYFDGLNRFYIAAEHADLARHFSCPPNPFDQYVGYHLWWARGKLEQAQDAERNALVNTLNHVLAEAQSLRNDITERDRQIDSLRSTAVERDRQLGEQVRQLEDIRSTLAERDRQLGGHVRQLEDTRSALAERDRQITALRDDQDRQQRELLAQVHQLSGSLVATERRLRSIRSSVSWKLTSPLREIRRGAVRIAALFGRLPAKQHVSKNPNGEQGVSNIAASAVAIPDEIAAQLTEPARSLYHALRESLTHRP